MLVILLDFAACGNRKALRLRAKGVPPVNDRVRMSQTTKRVPYDAIVSRKASYTSLHILYSRRVADTYIGQRLEQYCFGH